MKLKDFKIVVLLIFCNASLYAQYKVSGTVTSKENNVPIGGVEIYNKAKGKVSVTNNKGYYEFITDEKQLEIVFFSYEYNIEEEIVNVVGSTILNKQLSAVEIELTEVEVVARKAQIFNLKRLEDVVGTSIYAGKKTEVVLVNESVANLASNNARQIYSQVVGLNIFQNDDAGLQLNIGGRGLDPNRTSNFNTRQNGYDISADVLGYPESYYTPPAESLEEIQIIRGAASLQYGTQFGGLVNFVTKKPNSTKEIEVLTRNTVGSNNLYTNYTSVSGTKNKVSYYASFNFKQGDGFRPNSYFNSKNAFAHMGYQLSDKTKLEAEITYLNYLAQQAGGLTDAMFAENPYQSNRARNWFAVNWLLYNVKLKHNFTENTSLLFNFFGLNASRDALGFRTNRVNQVDTNEERDLITGDFKNFGFEAKLLDKYTFFGKKATYLIGTKFYKANNTSVQGPGSNGSDANFSSAINDYPNYPSQSNYKNPNLNIAFFGENIFYLRDNWSLTPGLRVEYIKTESDGFFKKINTDAAGNVILNETVESNDSNKRSFLLVGLGTSYKPNRFIEVYGNASQNYRSVTFSDLNIVNPSFRIGDLSDEKGYTLDLGLRGNYKNYISYDAGVFGLFYNDRIGLVTKALDDGSVVQERTNVGDARIVGVESLVDFNLKKILNLNSNYSFNYFINTSFINSEYTKSQQNGIKGNRVEFVPDLNLKTGVKFGWKNLLTSIQYTSLTQQYTDATNSNEPSLSGVNGIIPKYNILDLSLSYRYKFLKLETGINNLLDEAYFTRRATGYPGPGIIPSANRNYYATLEIKF
ncbi:TonB-dependent receptor domain-containing protein [Cellulophaga omnivescoria]|uniref:TonB-dependent receptor domain-containing protein n=1 Tax=Cellulophaga omnivescoria TaxID=1888890 RepID=UPI0022F02141|nr:TonB-dependent receptor [Cellulophaga omnivescoria]WBU89528.1 TonB-dependent receptor [Cellulophaga omnivescoria]